MTALVSEPTLPTRTVVLVAGSMVGGENLTRLRAAEPALFEKWHSVTLGPHDLSARAARSNLDVERHPRLGEVPSLLELCVALHRRSCIDDRAGHVAHRPRFC